MLKMLLPKRIPIKWKLTLIIFLVATTAIVSLVSFFTFYDTRVSKQGKQDRIHVIAEIVADNSTSALTFKDREDAKSVLSSLRTENSIRAAYLFIQNEGLFAYYLREGEPLSIPVISDADSGDRFEVDSYILQHPVVLNDKRIGTLYINSDLASLHERIRQRILFGVLLGSLSLFLALLLSLWLQKYFTKPMRTLGSLIERITTTNDYALRAPTTFKDEFSDLAEGLNHMLEEIQRQAKEITTQVELLGQSNKELDQFVYVASHDLKAPLRAVDNLAQLISKATKDVLPADKQEYLTLLHGRIKRMETLLDDLLAYSRVGRIETKLEQVDTAVMLKDVLFLMKPPDRFQIIIDKDMPVLKTAKTPLEQVFRNLIGNAVKHHSRPDGKIEIHSKDLGKFIEFTVSDDGAGIAPQYHEKIFQMFQTLKPRDQVEGSGMGLAMVKKIVEDQKGKITLRSAEGEGSSFIFTWPKNV